MTAAGYSLRGLAGSTCRGYVDGYIEVWLLLRAGGIYDQARSSPSTGEPISTRPQKQFDGYCNEGACLQ